MRVSELLLIAHRESGGNYHAAKVYLRQKPCGCATRAINLLDRLAKRFLAHHSVSGALHFAIVRGEVAFFELTESVAA